MQTLLVFFYKKVLDYQLKLSESLHFLGQKVNTFQEEQLSQLVTLTENSFKKYYELHEFYYDLTEAFDVKTNIKETLLFFSNLSVFFKKFQQLFLNQSSEESTSLSILDSLQWIKELFTDLTSKVPEQEKRTFALNLV